MNTNTGHVAHTMDQAIALLRLRPSRRPGLGRNAPCTLNTHTHTQPSHKDIWPAGTSPRHNHRLATCFGLAPSTNEAWLAHVSLHHCVQYQAISTHTWLDQSMFARMCMASYTRAHCRRLHSRSHSPLRCQLADAIPSHTNCAACIRLDIALVEAAPAHRLRPSGALGAHGR